MLEVLMLIDTLGGNEDEEKQCTLHFGGNFLKMGDEIQNHKLEEYIDSEGKERNDDDNDAHDGKHTINLMMWDIPPSVQSTSRAVWPEALF
eukprot:scaffold11604_cov76-Cyclotella_meneghiniana.AAC.2